MRTSQGQPKSQATARPRRSRRSERGQALSELLIACVVMIPMLFAIAFLGKLLLIQDAAIGAARWLAFECSLRPAPCEPAIGAAELSQRFFSTLDAPIYSGPVGAEDVSANPLWVDANNRPMLAPNGLPRASISPDSFDAGESVALTAGGARTANAHLFEQAGPQRFDLQARSGLTRISVQVGVQASLPVHPLLPIQLSANGAILADAWDASAAMGSEASSTQARVSAAREPVQIDEPNMTDREAGFDAIRQLLDAAGRSGWEPDAAQFRWRDLGIEILPEDRLAGAR